MPAYLVADIEVTDPVGFDEYRKKVSILIATFGGRYLVRGGSTLVIEGVWRPHRSVIIEFPTLVAFKAFWDSPEYGPLRALRERSARSSIVVMDGL